MCLNRYIQMAGSYTYDGHFSQKTVIKMRIFPTDVVA